MKILSRRKTDVREVWPKDTANDDESLIIPPSDLWLEAEQGPSPQEKRGGGKSEIESPIESISDPSEENYEGGTKSQCWAFMGAVGGVGTTSLAIQLAYELTKTAKASKGTSRRALTPQVCLVDLDFESGRCAHQLNIKPSLSIEDLNNDALNIDSALTEVLVTTHESGIDVLATPNMIGANSKVNYETVIAILDTVCNLYPYVILDVPYHWQDWSMAAIGGSDFVGLVTDPMIPSLHVAKSKYAQLGEIFGSDKSFEVILNKFERRSLRKNLSLKDAETALQKSVYETICLDPSVSQEAINLGVPAGAMKPDSRYVKDSRKLLNRILSTVHKSSDEPATTARLAG